MNRYGRYGAFLFLAAVFLSVFFLRFSRYPSPTRETQSLTATIAAAAPSTPAVSLFPQRPAPKHSPRKPAVESATASPIDINSATKEDLMALPGIGEVTAARIIEKRLELGGFSSVEELTEVKWIGKVKLERLRGLITVKNGPSKAKASLSTQKLSVERQTD